MAKYTKAFCGYCEFAENCEKHFFECDKHEGFAEIAKDQRKIDIEKAWKVFEKYATYIHPRKGEETCIMTKYKFIEAMEEER